jgi:glycosyltransferase involved in cell wall biosynthesis
MKVSFVTPAYHPSLMGASLYCQGLAKYLSAKGIDVTVYVIARKNLKKEEMIDGIHVKRFYPKLVGAYYISGGMLGSIIRDNADIVHSHHYGYYPATAGLLAAKIKKVPHVFGPYYHPPIYGLKRSIMAKTYHITQGLPLLRLSDKVLPHTNFEKQMLIKSGAKSENMELLPNIVDTNKFRPQGKKTKTVVFVSSLISEKGAEIAMKIAEETTASRNDVNFVFIGSKNEKQLLPTIEKLSKNRRIRFFSNLPLNDLIKWYQKSLVIFLPSRYEAFAKVLAEAQSCGAAVVATKVGGIPEVVKDGKTGILVDYGNWAEMKDKIEYLADNPAKAVAMGKNGRKNVVKNFDINVVGGKLIKIYEDVL